MNPLYLLAAVSLALLLREYVRDQRLTYEAGTYGAGSAAGRSATEHRSAVGLRGAEPAQPPESPFLGFGGNQKASRASGEAQDNPPSLFPEGTLTGSAAAEYPLLRRRVSP